MLNDMLNAAPNAIKSRNRPTRKKFATLAIFDKKASIMPFERLFA
jgi:hypothetical protein